MRWLLNAVYIVLLIAISPILLYRILVLKKYRDGWRQKFLGRLPVRGCHEDQTTRLWLHAVSVGEVLQLQTIIQGIREKRSDVEFVITTTTSTGLTVAREKYAEHLVCYFPLDFSWAVQAAFECIRPDAVILVELELWPNFILEADRRQIPLALVNGRISKKSFSGYRRIRPLMKRLLNCFQLLAVQNETYKQRLIELGGLERRIGVTGSVKFDGVQTDRQNPETEKLRAIFQLQVVEKVFVAGSTQMPEEAYALDTWLALRNDHPDLRLILVPRHKERFEQVAELVKGRGLPLVRRSEISLESDSSKLNRVTNQKKESEASENRISQSLPPVLLLDTLGELSACWGLADVAFVGGSLTTRGGQNMIEPAAYGAAVLFGPNTWNFKDIVELILVENGARVVWDRNDLTATVRFLLENPSLAENHGRVARDLVLRHQGATGQTVQAVCMLLIPEKEIDQPTLKAA